MFTTEGLPPYFVNILRVYYPYVFEETYMSTECSQRYLDLVEVACRPSVSIGDVGELHLQD